VTSEVSSSRLVECDVLVVGYGGAGAAAAIAATDAGSQVIVIEKRAIGGGATRLASGGIAVPSGPEFVDYLDTIWLGRTPRPVLERYVADASRMVELLAELGVETEGWAGHSQEVSVSYPPLTRPSWPKVPDGNMIRVHAKAPDEEPIAPELWAEMTNNERVWQYGRTYGIHLWAQLEASCASRDIEVHYDTPAVRVLLGDDGEAVGVIATRYGERVEYRARQAVILTTGGFASNAQMKDTYLSSPFVYAGTSDYAHGDGQRMTQVIGARMWHMQTVCGQIGFQAPGIDAAFQPRAVGESFIWVDRDGRRYVDETNEKLHNAWRLASHFDPERVGTPGQFPRVPVYMVFDETTRLRAPISRDWRAEGDHSWSLDNAEEVRRGWILAADTIEELAAKTEMDPTVLAETIARFNRSCADGADAEFGRSPSSMEPIVRGPFYALPMLPMLISTHGGPEHDENSRVVALDGEPIPRLYAAGELSSIVGWLYEAGTGHAEAIVFGRIAGQNAAALVRRPATEALAH